MKNVTGLQPVSLLQCHFLRQYFDPKNITCNLEKGQENCSNISLKYSGLKGFVVAQVQESQGLSNIEA